MRKRRTKAEIEAIKAAIYQAAEAEKPVTGRRVFYVVESQGLIEKTEGEYKGTICRLSKKMREDGELPFEWFADTTRWMRKPRTFRSLESFVDDAAALYRRDLWRGSPVYLEIWLEKNALASALYGVTEKWNVPLMVTVGYSSITFAYNAAQEMKAIGKPVYILHLTDHDDSGLDMSRDLEAKLRRYAGKDVELYFKRIAITREQIERLSLPTRPPKKKDPRYGLCKGLAVALWKDTSENLWIKSNSKNSSLSKTRSGPC